jgi:HSP20 family molecular chaperone IbpA
VGDANHEICRRTHGWDWVRTNFTETEHNGIVSLIFDLPGIPKSDVKVKFATQKITVAWQKVTVEEKAEGERLIRERVEKKYLRTIPIPPAVPVSLIRHKGSVINTKSIH